MSSARLRNLLGPLVVGLAVAAGAFGAPAPRPVGPLQLSFANYGLDDGLESLATTDLTQDHSGNLWIATQEGLVRFDGERFRTFDRDDGLPSSVVFDVEEDADGTLWAGTLRGLSRLTVERFEGVALPGSPAGEAVEALGKDGDGRLLAGAIGGAFRCRGDRCQRIFETPQSQFVAAIARDPNLDELWFAGPFGVVRWRNQEIERFDATRGLPSNVSRALLADRRGDLWIRQPEKVVRLDTGDGTISVEGGFPPLSEGSRFYEDRRGVIWLTTDRGLFFREGDRWRSLGVAQGLRTDAITSIVEDHEGSLWLGTAYDGVVRWLGRDRFVAWTRASGLPSDIVWAVARTSDGRLALGTQDGLALIAPDGNSLISYEGPGDLPCRQILALAADNRQGLWIGCYEGALAYLDASGQVTNVGRRQPFPADLAVQSIRIAADSTVWLGTNSGLWRGQGAPGTIQFRREIVPGEPGAGGQLPPAEQFSDLHLDGDGTLWAAGRYGLARWSAGRWQRYTRADGLLDDFLLSVDRSADGTLWIAYRDAHGVSRVHWQDGRPELRHFDRHSGLAHDQATFVRSDALGRLWVGTTRGLSVWTGERFANFGRADGMRSEDTSANAFLADANGTVWVGSSRGAMAIRLTAQDLGPPPVPEARFRAVLLGGAAVDSEIDHEVGFDRGSLEVAFGAKTFRSPLELEYRYRLSGADREPQITSQSRLRYASLSAGRYAFELEARLRGGEWGPPARMAFRVRPPWWGSRWAQIAALLAAAAVGMVADRLRGRRERRRQKELEDAVASRTRELKSSQAELAKKNDELAQLALTDPLTGLKNRRFAWELIATEIPRIDREWQSAAADHEPEARIVFFLMDVDLFKAINDLHGHEVGDQVLVEVAERVRAATRLSDVAVRWGGEEFLVIARDLPRAEWSRFAARLREAVARPPFVPSAEIGPVTCTASLGYAAYPFDRSAGVKWQQVLHVADLALYAVKQCGRNADLGVEPGVAWSGDVPVDLLASQMAGSLHLRWSSAGARRR